MRLMLTRHGQTAANVRWLLDTAMPGPPLTEEGHRQALDLATRLADEPVDAVYASTMLRAQQTAEPLAAKLGTEVRVRDGVQEIAAGGLEGRGDAEAIEIYQQTCLRWSAGDLDAAMPDAETGHEFLARYTGVLRELCERHSDDTVVLVSHGAAIRIAAGHLASNVDSGAAGLVLLENTAQVVLQDTGDGWECLAWSGMLD